MEQTQAVLDFYLRNRAFFLPWDPRRSHDFYTWNYQRQLLDADCIGWQTGRACRWWLYSHSHPNLIVGMAKLDQIIRGPFLSCYLSYSMDHGWLNQGLITEALVAVIDFAFNQLQLHRLEANVIPRNQPSLRVLAKLGFESEGLAHKYLKINEQWEDHIHMVLRNRDMEADT